MSMAESVCSREEGILLVRQAFQPPFWKDFLNHPHHLQWTECLYPSPPNSYVEILTLNVKVFGGWAFGRKLGHEDGALMNGISDLIKGTQESSSCLHQMRTQRKVGHLQTGRWPSPESDHVGTWYWTSRNKFLLFISHPVYGTMLLQPKLTRALSTNELIWRVPLYGIHHTALQLFAFLSSSPDWECV